MADADDPMPTPEPELPDLGAIIGRVLQRVPPQERPLLVAIAERMAAERYRGWADPPADAARRSQLLACAAREEEIAGRVEALYPGASSTQRDILAKNPDLEDLNRSIFAHRPLHEQFRIQAQGERLGAATWRAFARQEASATARETFLACAELEEASALVLESILGEAG
jgi:hypothetical protein